MPFGKNTPSEEISGYIGSGLRLEGQLIFPGKVKFEGELKGRLQGEKLVIGETGFIEGEVEAVELICSGRIEGKILTKRLHLRKTARIKGEIFSEKLLVEEGAQIEGQIKVGEAQIQPSGDGKEAS